MNTMDVLKVFQSHRKMSPQPATVRSESIEMQIDPIDPPPVQIAFDNSGFQADLDAPIPAKRRKNYERKKSRIGGREVHRNLGEKLNRIKLIHDRRRRICDYAFALAMLGVALMILEAEMLETKAYHVNSAASITVRSIVVLSTLGLLILILVFHWLDVELFLTTNGLHDWTLAFTWKRLFKLLIELIMCGVCITPGDYYPLWESPECAKDAKEQQNCVRSPTDLLLGIPMFSRFYLGARVMLMHSKMFTQPSRRVIGSVNRVNLKFSFYIKTLIYDSPMIAMAIASLGFWLTSSWILLCCERFTTAPSDGTIQNSYANAMWLTAITFLTVGYGDMVPRTYCGRTVGIIVGLMGTVISTLLVAVISRKLQLTFTERNIHDFMIEADLHSEAKVAAANIIKETWLVFKAQKCHKLSDLRKHRRKFLDSIRKFRWVKQKIRETADENQINQHNRSSERTISTLGFMESNFNQRLDRMETQLAELSAQIQSVIQLHSQRKNGNSRFED